LHREPRPARRYDFSRPRPGAHAVPFYFIQPRNPFHRRAADGADDVLFFPDGPVRDAPPNRTLDVPCLAIRFDHRRSGFHLPQGVCILDPVLIRSDLGEQGQETALASSRMTAYSETPVSFRIGDNRGVGFPNDRTSVALYQSRGIGPSSPSPACRCTVGTHLPTSGLSGATLFTWLHSSAASAP